MKMKKFMNAPETVTDEELVGLGLAYPDILNVDGHLVISKFCGQGYAGHPGGG